jgi:opacity protein-like surface antigen
MKIKPMLGLIGMLLSSAHAWTLGHDLHPVIGMGAGSANTSHLSQSRYFPIVNVDTDQFFSYSAQHHDQTKALYEGFLGIEKEFNPHWIGQLGLEYNQTRHFIQRGTLMQGADVPSSDTYAYQYRVILRQALIEGKLFYRFKHHVYPYVLAGLGTSFNKAYNFTTTVPHFLTFTREYSSDTSRSFTYAAGLGLDVDITCHLRAGISYRFTDAGRVKLGNATINDISVSGTFKQSHVYVNQLLAQLSWVF